MTAEVILVNRSAIALAADSAVTVGRNKVWKYGHKLFSSGPHNDIGLMIYNAGDFRGISWEIIIKEHRKKCALQRFSSVKDFVSSFNSFVYEIRSRPNSAQDLNLSLVFISLLEKIYRDLALKSARPTDQDLDFVIGIQDLVIKQRPNIAYNLDFESFTSRFSTSIKSFARDTLKRRLSKVFLDKIIALCYEHVTREYASDYSTGVVIAGYGSEELFPNIYHLIFDGEDGEYLRHWTVKNWNMNDKNFKQTSIVIPFAQSDMMFLFMEGIAQTHISYLLNLLGSILDKKSEDLVKSFVADQGAATVERIKQGKENNIIIQHFLSEFSKHRRKTLVSPIIERLRSLPKEEMAAVAEALVEITALRRKVSSSIESVGGPVDVAVISKGDGFIWIKRKKYFDLEKNSEFLYRKALPWEKGDEQAGNQTRGVPSRTAPRKGKPRPDKP